MKLILSICGMVCLLCSPGISRAQALKADPKALAVIERMSAAYRGLGALCEEIRVRITSGGTGSASKPRTTLWQVRFQRPNRLWCQRTDVSPGLAGKMLTVCDGASLWRLMSAWNVYSREKAPALLKAEPRTLMLPEFEMLTGTRNPFGAAAGFRSVRLVGAAKVAGQDADVIEARGSGEIPGFKMIVRLYVGRRDHLIHGAVTTSRMSMPGGAAVSTQEMSYRVVDTTPRFGRPDFTFTPPKGARQVEGGSLFGGLSDRGLPGR